MNQYSSRHDHPPVPRRQAGLPGITRWMLVLPLLAVTSAGPSQAQSPGLAGYWRGSGHIKPKESPREKVRCRVTYTRQSGNAFGVDAKCATASTNITQTGRVTRTGSNRYAGQFYNPDFNFRGRIRITIRGNRQFVTLSSGEASGSLTLFRR